MPAICPGRDKVEWPPAWVAMLREYWAGNASASTIAGLINAAFGAGITRNAVIGKVHRLGLQKSPADLRRCRASSAYANGKKCAYRFTRERAESLERARASLAERRREAAGRAPGPEAPAIPPTPIPAPEQISPDANPIALMDITARTCCWPVNDGNPQWLFCGAPRDPRSGTGERGYCTRHWRRSVGSERRGRRAVVADAVG